MHEEKINLDSLADILAKYSKIHRVEFNYSLVFEVQNIQKLSETFCAQYVSVSLSAGTLHLKCVLLLPI